MLRVLQCCDEIEILEQQRTKVQTQLDDVELEFDNHRRERHVVDVRDAVSCDEPV